VLISNTDDHLRNHGFLRSSTAGWSLSPAFDLNPDPRPGPKLLSTAIDEGSPEASIATLMSVADVFRLRDDDASGILAEAVPATAGWQASARRHGILEPELNQMASAFDRQLPDSAVSMKISIGLRSAPRRASIHSWLMTIPSKSFQIRSSLAQLYSRQGVGRSS
jgi:HipA-like C-terminal domain